MLEMARSVEQAKCWDFRFQGNEMEDLRITYSTTVADCAGSNTVLERKF
jgi:hypothetical protein